MSWTRKYQTIGFFAAGLFVLTGTYNAVVINSESSLYGSDIKFVKRLDEMYGVTVPGREAASISWKNLGPAPTVSPKIASAYVTQTVSKVEAAPILEEVEAEANDVPSAAIQEKLTLKLTTVSNPKRWKNGLTEQEFRGELTSNEGVIESLDIYLPNMEPISVVSAEMTGNVFEYDYQGERYSGMMYQLDKGSFNVTFSHGPLEGTNLNFKSIPEESYGQEGLAYSDVNHGDFGNNAEQYDQEFQAEEAQMELARNQAEARENYENNIHEQQLDQPEQLAPEQGYNMEPQQALNTDQQLPGDNIHYQ